MTLDPKSQLFQDAVAIAGRAYLPAPFVGGDEAEVGFHEGKWYWWTTLWAQPVSQGEAEFALEHHFRVWLEGHDAQVTKGCEADYAAHYFMCSTVDGDDIELLGKLIAEADTYLECQMLAVVEIDAAKKTP